MKVYPFAIYPFLLKQYTVLFKELCYRYDLTQAEIDVLAFLSNNPQYNHAVDIVKIRGINKGHASIAIDKLVSKGYLKKAEDPTNKRYQILKITENASSLLDEIHAIQSIYFHQSMNNISEEEYKIFEKVLFQTYINLGGYDYE